MRLDPAVDFRRHGRGHAGLALQSRPLPLQDEAFADAGDGIEMHAQGVGDPGSGHLAGGSVPIAHQEHLRMADLLGGRMAIAGDLLQGPPLLGVEVDRIEIRSRNHRCVHP